MRYWADGRVFITNGYGGTRLSSAKAYFYLIGRDIGALEQASEEFQRGKSELYRKAANTDKFAFSVIDSEIEQFRLNLDDSDVKRELYDIIQRSIPCLIKSDSALVDVISLENVKIVKLENFDQDFEWAKVEINRLTLNERLSLVSFLKFLDSTTIIEPGFGGVSLKGNDLLKKWIDRLEGK